MSRIYTDEDVRQAIVNGLREAGHDIETARDAGKDDRGVPDPEHLKYAAEQNRILLTVNRTDYRDLHNGGTEHKGIISMTFKMSELEAVSRVRFALKEVRNAENTHVRVNKGEVMVERRGHERQTILYGKNIDEERRTRQDRG